MTLKVHFDTRALAAQVDAMREDVQAATRPAAQAGAQLLYDAVKANVAALGRKTGNLQRSIYQVYSRDASTAGAEAYHVSWNAKKAPHGHLVEFGYMQRYRVVQDRRTGKWITIKTQRLATPVQVPPKAFVRRAGLQMPQALQAAETEFMKRLKVFK
jgi:HK97 gp10 family phage protein